MSYHVFDMIRDHVPSERGSVFIKVLSYLESLGHHEQQTYIENTFMLADSLGTDEVTARIDYCLDENLLTLIKRHGIVIDETRLPDMTLDLKFEILRGIIAAGEIEDREYPLGYIYTGMPNVDKILLLLADLTPIPLSILSDYIVDVKHDLIAKLIELYPNDRRPWEKTTMQERSLVFARKYACQILPKYLGSGGTLGYPLKLGIVLLIGELEILPVGKMAPEIGAIVMASGDVKDPLSAAKDVAEELIDNVDDLSRVCVQLNRIMGKEM